MLLHLQRMLGTSPADSDSRLPSSYENTGMTNLAKLDSALAHAMDSRIARQGLPLSVFIHMVEVPTDEQVQFLRQQGATSANGGRRILTATLSPSAVERVASQSWVKYLSLGSHVRNFAA